MHTLMLTLHNSKGIESKFRSGNGDIVLERCEIEYVNMVLRREMSTVLHQVKTKTLFLKFYTKIT